MHIGLQPISRNAPLDWSNGFSHTPVGDHSHYVRLAHHPGHIMDHVFFALEKSREKRIRTAVCALLFGKFRGHRTSAVT